METIFEIILEFLILIILQYPGAVVRWILIGRKKPIAVLLKDDFTVNASVAILSFLLIFLFIVILINVF